MAGTKGKGSTCAMIERMLREAGYRTGLFTSPHLIDVRERIRINGWACRAAAGRAGEALPAARRGSPATAPVAPAMGEHRHAPGHITAGCILTISTNRPCCLAWPPTTPGSEPVDRPTFLRNLRWCFDTLEEQATDDSGKPAYFRFLTLLSERRLEGFPGGLGGVATRCRPPQCAAVGPSLNDRRAVRPTIACMPAPLH